MTTIEFNDTAVDTSVTPTRTGWLRRWFAAWKHKRARRMTLIALSQMDERLLHDIGIEPMDVSNALSGLQSSALFNPIGRDGRS